jgi:hypothetical protein
MMICKGCLEEKYLIQNLCEDCAPVLHANRREWYEFIVQAGDRYEEETGAKVLDDWFSFEQHLFLAVENGEIEPPSTIVALPVKSTF